VKKAAVILVVLLLCILSTVGALILALRSARVQTAAVAVLTEELSRALHVVAHIDRVEIRPPLSMCLQGVFLSDQQGDTLLSVPRVNVRFNPFALEEKKLCFPLIELCDPAVNIVHDRAFTNLDFLMQVFSKQSDQQSFSYSVECRKIAITGARVRYRYLPSATDVLLSDIHTDIGLVYAGKDSVATMLRTLHAKAQMQGVDGSVEADFHGTLDTLFADELKVIYHGHRLFYGDVCVQRPMQVDSLYAQLRCTDLCANASLLSSLLSDITHHPVQLPKMVSQLGTIHYRGSIEGRLNNLLLHGAFLTRVGSISTNVRMLNNREVHGQIRTSNLALNRWLGASALGRLSASLNIDGDWYDSIPRMKADGVVYQLEYKNYSYSNIMLQVDMNANVMRSSLCVDDPNLQLHLLSDWNNWMSKSPKLDMDIRVPKIDLAALHLSDSVLEQTVALNTTICLRVDSTMPNMVDGTVGTIRCDSIRIRGAGHELYVPELTMEVLADSMQRKMTISSSVLKAEIKGHFQWTSVLPTISGFIHRSLPSLTQIPIGHVYQNDMDFHAELLQANDLLRVLGQKQLTFPSVPSITGFVHESDSSFAIRLWSDEVIKNNSSYQNMYLALDNDNPQRNATASFFIMQHIIRADSTRLRIGDLMMGMRMTAHHDSITTALEFGPIDTADSIPDVLIETAFSQLDKSPCVDVHFLPSDFQLGRMFWHIDDSHINYSAADTSLTFRGLRFTTPDQLLSLEGCMSPRLSDSLNVQFHNLDLGYLLSSTKILDAVDLRGVLNGEGTLYGAFSAPQFEADVYLDSAQINRTDLGRVSATAELDRQSGEVVINGSAVHNDVHLADVSGRVVAASKYWELFIDANGMPLDFINFWTSGIVEQISGKAYGRVHLFGRNMLTWVTTRAFAENAALTVPYTGARYFFSDSVFLDTCYIDFPSIHLSDGQGHHGVFSGRLNHTNFKHFNYQFNAKCNQLLALDLPASSKSMYYGKAYATGNVDISGNDRMSRIDVNASTAGNTDFYLSLATASNASSSEFITFKQHDMVAVDTIQKVVQPKSRFLLNLSIETLPTAKVHLVLNEHNGDGIVGRGEGNIRLSMDASTGEVQMLGTYSLLNGTFAYTVGNLVHRDFTIAEGSTVSWSGDPANPQLDITAKYRCTASLRDLFGADVKQVTSRPSIPVDCVIRITGTMNNMILKFGIEYPQSDESVSAQINSIINTEAMLMRQVVYLLVFNRFYTPENLRTANTGLNDAYSLLSSTVTGQINSWLSKLTSMVNVGFNMRSNMEQGNQSYETEANIQIQPVNRLTINGNLGYRYNDLSNQPIFGDADVEYELTADGKLRAKVFTHSVDKYSLHQSGMQEGIGFIFRHDFNPGDAKLRREARKNKK